MHINESIPFEDINADPEVNLNDKKYVVIYPGRFHPFHKGHASVYKHLKSKYDTVFIATSDKVAPPKSPFSFEEKKKMMMHTGVPANAIVQTKQPYIPLEILEHYDPASTVVIFAVSDKDMAEDPRFSFKPKKNGEPSYFQPLNQQNLDGYENHGYIITVPTLDFTVLDEPMRSATEFRSNFAKADHETQAAMIKDMYGTYNKEIHNIMAEKITESAYNWLNNDLVLNETFDQPYDYKWEMQHPKKWWATAELERPSVKLSIVIQKVFDNEWEIEFTRDMSQDKTGEGDAMRIFATVIKALKEFVADVHPEYINFRAEKTGSNTDSRPNLYRKLIKRYAKEWGYKDDEREKHSDGAYGINPKTEFLLTRSDLTNESCYNFLHEVGSNTITKSDFGATAWMTKKEWEYYTDRYDIAGDLNDKYSVMLDNTDMSRVGKVSVIETNGNRRRIVGSIDVKSYPGKLRFQTYYTKLAKAAQGKGLAKKLYMFLMKELGWTLVSGDSQSEGARKVWASIIKHPRVLAWSQPDGGRKKIPVWYNKETNELDGLEDPYSLDNTSNLYNDKQQAVSDLYAQYEKIIEILDDLAHEGGITNKEYKTKVKQLDIKYGSNLKKINKAFDKELDQNYSSDDLLLYVMWSDKIVQEDSDYRFVREDSAEKETDLELNDLEPSLRPAVRKAMIKFPMAKDRLSATIKMLQQDVVDQTKATKSINRLDKENDVQDNDIDTLDNEINDEELQREKLQAELDNINARLTDLESKKTTESSYSFLRDDRLNELRIEKPVDDNWGIPRSKMPQIKTEDYKEFIDYLAGHGIHFTKERVQANTLQPIQGEFKDEGVVKSIEMRKNEKPIIASSDDHILDGHHRWLAALNTGTDILIYRVDKAAKELMNIVLDFPKVYFKDLYEQKRYETISTESGREVIAVDVISMQLEGLRQHITTKPELFEDTEEYRSITNFLEHNIETPEIGKSYIYASVLTLPMAKSIHITSTDEKMVFIEESNGYMYFKHNNKTYKFPDGLNPKKDALQASLVFESLEDYDHFNLLMSLGYSTWNIKRDNITVVNESKISHNELNQLETFADRLFNKVGIDVNFTRHFLDRVNDDRNKKQITPGELTRLFKQEYRRWGKPIAQLGPNAEAILKDLQTDINLPFVLQWDNNNNELDLIAKTVMRKKDFKSNDQAFTIGEAVGIIDKQNSTVDVKPGETRRQAAKFGNNISSKNEPPLLHKSAARNSTRRQNNENSKFTQSKYKQGDIQ